MTRKETTDFLGRLLEIDRFSGIGKYWAKEASIEPWPAKGKPRKENVMQLRVPKKEKIRKCPFCAKKGKIEQNTKEVTMISCDSCGATITGKRREEAIRKWNMRKLDEQRKTMKILIAVATYMLALYFIQFKEWYWIGGGLLILSMIFALMILNDSALE